MLVLSRKVGEQIHIGDDIKIEVRRVAGNRVAIALSAPRDMRILRGELKEAAEEFEVPAGDAEVGNQSGTLPLLLEQQFTAITTAS